MQNIIKALSVAERFGRLTQATATVSKPVQSAAHDKLMHAHRLSRQANDKRADALELLAEEMLKLHGEPGALVIINGVRADHVPGQDESHAIEASARRIAFDISRSGKSRKPDIIAREMAGMALSAGAWVQVLARVEVLETTDLTNL